MRGGGGGTWGVATSVTYKAHPVVRPAVFAAIGSNLTLGRSDLETVLSKLASLAPDLADSGFSGVSLIDNSSITVLGFLMNGDIQKLQRGATPIVISYSLS